jgi:hypothetical protein
MHLASQFFSRSLVALLERKETRSVSLGVAQPARPGVLERPFEVAWRVTLILLETCVSILILMHAHKSFCAPLELHFCSETKH